MMVVLEKFPYQMGEKETEQFKFVQAETSILGIVTLCANSKILTDGG